MLFKTKWDSNEHTWALSKNSHAMSHLGPVISQCVLAVYAKMLVGYGYPLQGHAHGCKSTSSHKQTFGLRKDASLCRMQNDLMLGQLLISCSTFAWILCSVLSRLHFESWFHVSNYITTRLEVASFSSFFCLRFGGWESTPSWQGQSRQGLRWLASVRRDIAEGLCSAQT